jgi:archaellum component FlaC
MTTQIDTAGTGAAFTATPESISSAISKFTFPDIDISKIISEIKNTGLATLEKDISTITGFSERQVTALAQQTKIVARGILTGEITKETREFFLKSLKEMAENFVRTLQGILDVLIDKFLNAVIGILWKTIETAVGFKLPSLA